MAYQTLSKKMDFILSLGNITKQEDNERPNEVGERVKDKPHTYIFKPFDVDAIGFIDITQDVKTFKDFVNTIFNICTFDA